MIGCFIINKNFNCFEIEQIFLDFGQKSVSNMDIRQNITVQTYYPSTNSLFGEEDLFGDLPEDLVHRQVSIDFIKKNKQKLEDIGLIILRSMINYYRTLLIHLTFKASDEDYHEFMKIGEKEPQIEIKVSSGLGRGEHERDKIIIAGTDYPFKLYFKEVVCMGNYHEDPNELSNYIHRFYTIKDKSEWSKYAHLMVSDFSPSANREMTKVLHDLYVENQSLKLCPGGYKALKKLNLFEEKIDGINKFLLHYQEELLKNPIYESFRSTLQSALIAKYNYPSIHVKIVPSHFQFSRLSDVKNQAVRFQFIVYEKKDSEKKDGEVKDGEEKEHEIWTLLQSKILLIGVDEYKIYFQENDELHDFDGNFDKFLHLFIDTPSRELWRSMK